MTHLAEVIANKVPERRALRALQDETLLPLNGPGPFNPVFVKIATDHAEFSYGTEHGFSDLQWFPPKGTPPTAHALITFAFETPTIIKLESLTPGLTFSAVNQRQQTGSVPATGGPYHFNIVTLDANGKFVILDIDPKIVVTPL